MQITLSNLVFKGFVVDIVSSDGSAVSNDIIIYLLSWPQLKNYYIINYGMEH